MAVELQENEKMKNDFISSVSHELRTPLTAIKGWAETLMDDSVDRETTKKESVLLLKKANAFLAWWRNCWTSAVCKADV